MIQDIKFNFSFYLVVFIITVCVFSLFLISAHGNEVAYDGERTYEMTDHNIKQEGQDNHRTIEQDDNTVLGFSR